MSIWMSLKIFSDLCVLFAILGAFPTVIEYHSLLIIPALICAVGAGIATGLQNSGKDRLRWIGIIFPLAALYLSLRSSEEWLILPAAAYTVLVILRGKLHLEYYSYRQSFRNSMIIVGGLYVIFSMLSFLEGISASDVRTIYTEATLRYGLIHVITGIILQRQLRLGVQNSSGGSHLQMAAIMGGTGVVVLAFVAAEPALRKGAAAVFQAILSAVMSTVVFLYERFMGLLNQVELKTMYETVEEARSNRDMPTAAPVLQQIIQENTQATEEEQSLWWLVLVGVVLIITAVFLLRAFGNRTASVSGNESVHTIEPFAHSKKEPRRTNRGKVRHYYREYLRYERKQGLSIKKYYTSNDILQKSLSNSDPSAVTSLRQIYLLARYDENSEITAEQVSQAKEALRKIRSGGIAGS